MNRLKNILLWMLIITYVILALGFTGNGKDAVSCSEIEVFIRDSMAVKFVTGDDVVALLHSGGDSILGDHLGSNELSRLEKKLCSHPAIRSAELYHTVDGVLKADIIQRKPVVRFIDNSGRHYYIDMDGYFLPATHKFSECVPVVSGYLSPDWYRAGAVHLAGEDPNQELLQGLFELSGFVYQNEFWRSQIVQIYVNSGKELELIPRLGAHVIYFGSFEDYRGKLLKLEALYRQGFKSMGWNQYGIINLKYKDQVICTKKIQS